MLQAGFSAETSDSLDGKGAQVLARGPVHEAFAGVISYHPQPGAVLPSEPPEMVEEVPPDQKPEGENVTWIPGYWAWDDERNDFLWVSGIWRALPPGRQWVAGYWGQSGSGFQWTTGYWADTAAGTTTYLPTAPPATLENGPSVTTHSDDEIWIPGCWIWTRRHYAWSPGYWMQAQADWDWNPGYYVWTPHGYVFVDGYWDYSLERRGVLFAPIYFDSGVRTRRYYRYSPQVVIDLEVLPNHLFLRPRDDHYYLGDYYAAGYSGRGFYASFSYQSGGYGYDPIYAHQRWDHRQDKDWEKRFESRYQNRRDHENVRPVRTWADQNSAARNAGHQNALPKNAAPIGSSPSMGAAAKSASPDESKPVAMSFDQLSKAKDNQRRFRPLAKEEQQQFGQRGQEVKKSREGRRNLEANRVAPPVAKAAASVEPSTLDLPKSPIVSKPTHLNNERDRAPPRPGLWKGQNRKSQEEKGKRDKREK